MGGGSGRRKWEEEECEKYKLRHVHCDLAVFFLKQKHYTKDEGNQGLQRRRQGCEGHSTFNRPRFWCPSR